MLTERVLSIIVLPSLSSEGLRVPPGQCGHITWWRLLTASTGVALSISGTVEQWSQLEIQMLNRGARPGLASHTPYSVIFEEEKHQEKQRDQNCQEYQVSLSFNYKKILKIC